MLPLSTPTHNGFVEEIVTTVGGIAYNFNDSTIAVITITLFLKNFI
jgi:hypothetical protein